MKCIDRKYNIKNIIKNNTIKTGNRIGAAFIAALCFCMLLTMQADAAAPESTAVSTTASYQVTSQPTWYVQTTKESTVYAEPFLEAAKIADVPENMIFIVTGVVDNGWCQVYYMGLSGYMTPAELTVYTGGEDSVSVPKLDIQAGYHVSFLGDSFTYGDKLRDRSLSYAALLAGMMQAGDYENYGLNGSCMGGIHPDRFIDRYAQIPADTDLIFVFGGTNDYEFATPMGAMTDTDSTTFYGCLNLLMCSLQQKYPDAEIVFLTPMHRNGGTKKNTQGYVLEDYAYAMINMGEFYDIPVIDLYHAQGLDFTGSKRYLADGLHPTAIGHRRIAQYLYSLLFDENN